MDYNRLVLLHPNLQSFWRLDEGSGDAVDLGPGGHAGTVGASTDRSQSPVMHSSQSSASMGFGATGKLVTCGDFYDFAGTAAFTVVVWGLRTGSSSSVALVNKRQAANADGWSLLTAATDQIALQRRISGSTVQALTAGTMTGGDADMVAGTYDGATIRTYIFRGGSLITSASQADARSLANTDGELTIGRNGNVDSGHFNGTLSDVAIYDAALPQDMLMRLHLVGFRHRRPARIGF